jgi:uncharacterized protein
MADGPHNQGASIMARIRAKLWDPKAWPAPGRVSFGRIIAPRVGAGADVAAQIDAGVEGAYTTRLWSNG